MPLIDRDGITAVAADLERIAHLAHAVGITAPSVDVLADPQAPEVVRARAFARVAAHLARLPREATRVDRFTAVA